MIFANIEYLFLLVLLIPYIVWYVMKRKKTEPTLQVSTTRMYMKAPKSWKIYLLHAPFVLRTVAILMVILILARPQTTDNWQNTEIEGIDIMLAVDVSTSMLAEDLKPNRLEAAKQVASEFINGRPNDNIGLTICECPRRDRRKDFDRDCRYNERKLFPCHQQFQVEGSLSGDRQTGENEVEREGIQQTRRRISGIRLDCFLLHFA